MATAAVTPAQEDRAAPGGQDEAGAEEARSGSGATAPAPGSVREVGGAATWSLSSCKPGYGVQQLRDGCIDTYWQSDGQLPHLVNVQFRYGQVTSLKCLLCWMNKY